MRIDVKIDTSKLVTETARQAKNLAFSTAQALNDTAKEVQKEARVEVGKLFKPVVEDGLRTKSTLFGRAGGNDDKNTRDALKRRFRVLLKADARQGRPFAIVGYRDQRSFKIADFDAVAERYGRDPIIYNVAERKVMSLKDLDLRTVRVTPRNFSKDTQLKGIQKTFGLLETKTYPKGAIFQRTGPGPQDMRVLISYARWQDERLALKLINLPELARRVYERVFQQAFLRRWYNLKK